MVFLWRVTARTSSMQEQLFSVPWRGERFHGRWKLSWADVPQTLVLHCLPVSLQRPFPLTCLEKSWAWTCPGRLHCSWGEEMQFWRQHGHQHASACLCMVPPDHFRCQEASGLRQASWLSGGQAETPDDCCRACPPWVLPWVSPGLGRPWGSTAPSKVKGPSCALGCVCGLKGTTWGWTPAQLRSAGADWLPSGPQLFVTWCQGVFSIARLEQLERTSLVGSATPQLQSLLVKMCLSKGAAARGAAGADNPLSRGAQGLSLPPGKQGQSLPSAPGAAGAEPDAFGCAAFPQVPLAGRCLNACFPQKAKTFLTVLWKMTATRQLQFKGLRFN